MGCVLIKLPLSHRLQTGISYSTQSSSNMCQAQRGRKSILLGVNSLLMGMLECASHPQSPARRRETNTQKEGWLLDFGYVSV